MDIKYPISFVIPVYKSEETIGSVVESIASIDQFDWEVVLVNDNSPDDVDKVIHKLIKIYPKKIIYLRLHKNCGQQAALINGFGYTTKKYVATIDDDGQNPPIEVLKMLKKMNESSLDIVYGQIKDRRQSLARRIISKLNIAITKYTIGNTLGIPFSNVRLMRDNLVKNMAESVSQYNYIEGLIFSLTSKIGYVEITQNERIIGKSTYNIFLLLALLSNHIVGYSNITLKLLSTLSLCISFFAFIFGVVYLMITIGNENRPTGWLSIYLSITFLFSMLFLILGILTEYISRIYSKMSQPNNKTIISIYK